VLVTNEVRDPVKLARLALLAQVARVAVCVDDLAAVAEVAAAAAVAVVEIGVLVELDCGHGRCGVTSDADLVALAQAVQQAPRLRYEGVQAYHGSMQHIPDREQREAVGRAAQARLRQGLAALAEAGLTPGKVSGGGTGSFRQDAESGLWTELQCGSYAFMDADYGRIDGAQGRLDGEFQPALFVLASVISRRPGKAVADAGLKSLTGDSGLPVLAGFQVLGLSDEHVEIADPDDTLQIRQRLRLVPGHCDPTVDRYDWYVGVRRGRVECLWPVAARGAMA
jgi:3-hydroxy-D-aspartate aldolase